jgi:hypothetical protein
MRSPLEFRLTLWGKTSDSGMLKVNVGEHEVLSTEVDELRTMWENVIPHHMESSKS